MNTLDIISISVGIFAVIWDFSCTFCVLWSIHGSTFSLRAIAPVEWKLLFRDQGMVGCVFLVTHMSFIPGSSVFNSIPCSNLAFSFLIFLCVGEMPGPYCLQIFTSLFMLLPPPSQLEPLSQLCWANIPLGYLSHLIGIPKVPSPPFSLPNGLLD